MPQCVICKKFLPSDFCEKDQLANVHRCHFCLKGQDVIFVGNTMYNKLEVINDYEIFTKKIAQSPNIKDKIKELTIQAAVDKYEQEK